MKFEFFDRFSKNPQTKNFLKFRPVGAELFHVDGQTDMKLRDYFAILCKSSQNILDLPVSCAQCQSKYSLHHLKLLS